MPLLFYGARANNGVILVTTKRGKEGKGEVSVKAKVGINYYNNPYEFMNAGDYIYWMRTAYQRSGQIYKDSKGNWVGTADMNSLNNATPYGTVISILILVPGPYLMEIKTCVPYGVQ